jgi:hypothetical protein
MTAAINNNKEILCIVDELGLGSSTIKVGLGSLLVVVAITVVLVVCGCTTIVLVVLAVVDDDDGSGGGSNTSHVELTTISGSGNPLDVNMLYLDNELRSKSSAVGSEMLHNCMGQALTFDEQAPMDEDTDLIIEMKSLYFRPVSDWMNNCGLSNCDILSPSGTLYEYVALAVPFQQSQVLFDSTKSQKLASKFLSLTEMSDIHVTVLSRAAFTASGDCLLEMPWERTGRDRLRRPERGGKVTPHELSTPDLIVENAGNTLLNMKLTNLD